MWGSHNLLPANAVCLAPSAHNEGIIEGQDGDDIDALLAELGQVVDVSGDVVHGAGGGESACSTEYPALAKSSIGLRATVLTYREQRTEQPSCRPTFGRHCS